MLLEIAVDGAADALAAAQAGADRLELCARLDQDGLTPELDAVRAVLAQVAVPVFVMIRPRAGAFHYTPEELAAMRGQLAALHALGPAGFVFGAADAAGVPDPAALRPLLADAGPAPCVYHRAFDAAPDPLAALHALATLGFRRVLTSGGAADAAAGASRIAGLRRAAAGTIEVLPGGGVRPENAAALVRATGCDQVHSSARRRGRFDAETVRALAAVLASI